MGIKVENRLVCDRCGKSVLLGESETTPFDVAGRYPGWFRADTNRFLCPDCSPGYEAILNRQEEERENYIAGK